MRKLVNRGGGKPVTRVQAADKTWREQHSARVMNAGIPKIIRDGTSAVASLNTFEVLRYFVKGFVPADALPAIRGAANRMLEPVFVVVKILQCDGLRADVTSAEGVIFVTPDIEPLIGLNGDLDSTDRFAEIASAIVKGTIGRGPHG